MVETIPFCKTKKSDFKKKGVKEGKQVVKEVRPSYDPSKFMSLSISTMTSVVTTNWNIDISTLFDNISITDYIVVKKKRGRKKKQIVEDPNKDIKPGSIVCMEYSGFKKGSYVKKSHSSKGKDTNTPFRNSLTLVIKASDKYINIKLSNNGKLQLTGSKKMEHTIFCIDVLWKKIVNIQKKEGCENVYSLKNDEVIPRAVLKVVMTNVDYDIGYNINRQKLDYYINNDSDEFISIFEPSAVYAGVNIKIPSTDPVDKRITNLYWLGKDNTLVKTQGNYNCYLDLLTEKERLKEVKSSRYHTFLVFYSGRVIQSGPSLNEMNIVHNRFIDFVNNFKGKLIEKIK